MTTYFFNALVTFLQASLPFLFILLVGFVSTYFWNAQKETIRTARKVFGIMTILVLLLAVFSSLTSNGPRFAPVNKVTYTTETTNSEIRSLEPPKLTDAQRLENTRKTIEENSIKD